MIAPILFLLASFFLPLTIRFSHSSSLLSVAISGTILLRMGPNHALQRTGTAALSRSCVPAAELCLVRRLRAIAHQVRVTLMPKKHYVVADGWGRAYRANIRAVRGQVLREFSPRLAEAGFWRRFVLWVQFQAEVRRRMRRI